MKNVKVITMLLAITMALQILSACGEKSESSTKDNTTSTTAAEENAVTTDGEEVQDTVEKIGFSVSQEKENIPDDANFGGKNFVILVGDPNEQVWTYTNMIVE